MAAGSPLRYLLIERATLFPAAMASITEAGPVPTSPPANIPSIVVTPVVWSISIVPILPRESPSSRTNSVSGTCPSASITVSTGIVNSDPFIGTGRGRPLSSVSPSSIFTHSIPESRPFSARNRVGIVRKSMVIPSCSISDTSADEAGISSRERR